MKKIFPPTQCLSREVLKRYAKGEISGDLRFQVENHLLDCPLCDAALAGFAAIEDQADTDAIFEDIFEQIDSKTMTPPQVQSKTRRLIPWNNIAASLLFLVSLGAAFWYFQSSQATQPYLAHFEDQDDKLLARSINKENLPTDIQPGILLYNKEDFQASLSFFEDYLKLQPESSTAAYYAGLSALDIGELGRALDYLATARINDAQLYDVATWGMVRIHLERGEKQVAIQLLEELLGSPGSFLQDKATILLEDLKKEAE